MSAITVKDLFNNTHEITLCTEEDIEHHYAKIQTLATDVDTEVFKRRMRMCVTKRSAFRLKDNSCFLYYFNTNKYQAKAAAFYGEGYPIKTLALLFGIFTLIDLDTIKVDLHLHKNSIPGMYRSISTPSSIKSQAKRQKLINIRVDSVKTKITKVYKKKGIL